MEPLASLQESWLSWFLKGLLIFSGIVLLARLIELQVIKGDYFRKLAEENRIRSIPITAPRGKILSRTGEILVDNSVVYKKIVFDNSGGWQKTFTIEKENNPQEIFKEWDRNYILGENFAHVSGYIGEVNEKEVGKIDPSCPDKGVKRLGELIGRSGLEERYNCQLSGADGEELIEVNTKGIKVRTLGRKEPIAGKDLKTSIDFGLQKKVAEAVKGKKGAVIVSDGHGQILALVSSPAFDPKKVVDYVKDNDLPLFNRAISGVYHPGSVFKLVTAVAALEEKLIDDTYTYSDPGVIKIKEFSYSNWFFNQYGKTEGVINLTRALARSTDTFFYKLGEILGADRLVKWAKKFQLDKKTKIDLPGEAEGLVPSPEWKEKVKKESWFLGNTYHMAIGQGDIALTPLAVNMETAVIASRGLICTLSIAQKPGCTKMGIKEKTIEEVKKGMIAACSTGGTAFPFFGFKIPGLVTEGVVACKTGTAQTQKIDRTHAWITLFAPADDFPEIVVTVMIEEGGEGSYVAAPLAKEIVEYYFSSHK